MENWIEALKRENSLLSGNLNLSWIILGEATNPRKELGSASSEDLAPVSNLKYLHSKYSP